jgi:hypothetical protein
LGLNGLQGRGSRLSGNVGLSRLFVSRPKKASLDTPLLLLLTTHTRSCLRPAFSTALTPARPDQEEHLRVTRRRRIAWIRRLSPIPLNLGTILSLPLLLSSPLFVLTIRDSSRRAASPCPRPAWGSRITSAPAVCARVSVGCTCLGTACPHLTFSRFGCGI